MIREYKQMCYQSASLIPEWKNIDKNDLCRRYVSKLESNDSLSDSYLSAILYKFWNVTEHNYFSQKYKLATEGDCIDWTITGVLRALNQHVWDNPNNILYGDSKGPEKAINVCIYTTKINFYQRIKHQKEKLTYESLSLEAVLENAPDAYCIPIYDADTSLSDYISVIIREAFKRKDYIKAFALDKILNDDVFEQVVEDGKRYSQFSDKKLRKRLRNMNFKYCHSFAYRYNLSEEDVRSSISNIVNLSYYCLFTAVRDFMGELRKDRKLLSYLVG